MRTALAVALAVGGLALALTADASPSSRRDAAERLVRERATEAIAALDRLETAVGPALADARRGAARTVAGATLPGASLAGAAGALADAEAEAIAVRRAMGALEGARRMAGIGAPLAEPIERGELGSVAAQLDATADAADAFAAMRLRTERLPETLDAALVALADGDLDEGGRLVESARSDHDAVSTWEVELLTLPVWIETTDAMIGDLETIVSATRAGEEARAAAAAEAFAARADDATTADRALRIAIGEGGAAVTAAPLGRLAALLDRVAAARAAAEALAS